MVQGCVAAVVDKVRVSVPVLEEHTSRRRARERGRDDQWGVPVG